MSEQTPRQMLQLRVLVKFRQMGWPTDMVDQAVDEFYNGDQSGTYFAVVAAESYQLVIDVIPPFASNILSAFQQMQATLSEMANSVSPYIEMANRAKLPLPEPPADPEPRYSPTGLPMTDGPFLAGGASSVYSDTPDPAPENLPDEVSDAAQLPDATSHMSIETDGTLSWGPIESSPGDSGRRLPPAVPGDTEPRTGPGVLDDEQTVPELTTREFHLAVARRLRQLGCTYGELEQMHRRNGGDFETAQHHSAWFAFGGMVNLEQLDRANFVLDSLERGDAFGIPMSDEDIERAEATYPTDRLTGAPYHFVVNGDHTACGCGGHLLECETWSSSTCAHAASICGINRTLCGHHPRHKYREPCSDDPPVRADDSPDMRRFRSEGVGLATEGSQADQ